MNFQIKEARERVGLSQKELAERIGVAPNTFHGYESGKHDPKSNLLIDIAKICGVSVDFLLGIEGNENFGTSCKDGIETLTSDERSRLSISMAQMNKQGRERVEEYAEDLAAGGRYAKVPLTISGQKNMAAARSGDRVAVASVSAEDEEAALPAPSHSTDI